MKKKFKLLALLLSACILGSGIPGVIPSAPTFAEEDSDGPAFAEEDSDGPVPVEDYDDSELDWFVPDSGESASGESASIAADADPRSVETNAAIEIILIQKMSPDQSAETAGVPATPIDPAKSNIHTNLTIDPANFNVSNSTEINLEKFLTLSGDSSAGSGGDPANWTLADMSAAASSLSLKDDEAVMFLTVDNFWIADRSPATEEEQDVLPKVILDQNSSTQLYVNGQEATVVTNLEKAIEAGGLENEGVGGLVVRLKDSIEGMRVVFIAPSGVTYQLCGAVILNNGKQIQVGNPCNKSDTSQQFGEVKMKDSPDGPTCFFSTVYSDALGLFPGEMLISRYMVIQDAEGKPILYWFDETGSRTELGPLKDRDPDGTIAKIFSDAGYENGLPRTADGNSFPEGFKYLAHDLTYTIQQAPTCLQRGLELIKCNTCDFELAKNLPATGHRLKKTEKKEATCTETGTEAYWTCAFCHRLFADEAGLLAIGQPAVIPVNHDNHDLEYVRSASRDASCTEDGLDYYVCRREDCGYTKRVKIEATGHTLTPTAAKKATCTEPGNSAYWTCDVCGKFFSDEQGKTEIALADTVIKAAGHTLTPTAAKEASCTEGGHTAYWTCDVCGKLFSDEQGETEITQADTVIEAGHKLVKTEAVEPTTEQAGRHEYWTCSVCGKFFGDAEGENEIAENSWILKLKTTIQAPGLSIPPREGMTVGEAVELLFSDATLVYDGAPVGRSDTMSYTCNIDAGMSSVDAAGSSFQATVSIAPENTEIYETATGTFTVSIEPLELTPGS